MTDVSTRTTLQFPALDKTYGNSSGDLSYMGVLVLRSNGGATDDDHCTRRGWASRS